MPLQKHFSLYFMSKINSSPADYKTFPTLFELEPVAGFEDADDCDRLCGDGILKMCAGRGSTAALRT